MPDPRNIRVGPGWLYIAALGSTEPADLTTAWANAWTRLGWTDEGHTFNQETNVEAIEVAEQYEPVMYETTGREMTVAFALAEITARNLQIALNGGTITLSGAGANQIATFEPPDIGSEIRVMLGWEAFDAKERFVWRKCFQGGGVEMARRKAPDKTLIPMEFRIETPFDAGTGAAIKPYKAIFSQPAAAV